MHPAWEEATARSGEYGVRLAYRRVSVDPITLAATAPHPPEEGLDVADVSHDLFLHSESPLREGRPHRRQLLVASLGKSLSVPAGLIAGPKRIIAAVRALPAFRGASPPPPAYVHAVSVGWCTVAAAQRHLARVTRAVGTAVRDVRGGGLVGLDDYPVIVVRDPRLVHRLRRAGYSLSAVRYPTSASAVVHRVVLRADLADEAVTELARVLSRAGADDC